MELEFDVGSVPERLIRVEAGRFPLIGPTDAGAAGVPPGWRAEGAGEEPS